MMERITQPVVGQKDVWKKAVFKFRVALEESKAVSQLSSEHEIRPILIRDRKRQLPEDGPRVFARIGERKQREQEAQEAEL